MTAARVDNENLWPETGWDSGGSADSRGIYRRGSYWQEFDSHLRHFKNRMR
jgi:hypothetical protein